MVLDQNLDLDLSLGLASFKSGKNAVKVTNENGLVRVNICWSRSGLGWAGPAVGRVRTGRAPLFGPDSISSAYLPRYKPPGIGIGWGV